MASRFRRSAVRHDQEKGRLDGIDPNASPLNWNIRRPTQGPVGLAIKNRKSAGCRLPSYVSIAYLILLRRPRLRRHGGRVCRHDPIPAARARWYQRRQHSRQLDHEQDGRGSRWNGRRRCQRESHRRAVGRITLATPLLTSSSISRRLRLYSTSPFVSDSRWQSMHGSSSGEYRSRVLDVRPRPRLTPCCISPFVVGRIPCHHLSVSGGLFNPAVSLGMVLVGALTPLRGALLTISQILGGITGKLRPYLSSFVLVSRRPSGIAIRCGPHRRLDSRDVKRQDLLSSWCQRCSRSLH